MKLYFMANEEENFKCATYENVTSDKIRDKVWPGKFGIPGRVPTTISRGRGGTEMGTEIRFARHVSFSSCGARRTWLSVHRATVSGR